MTTNSSGSFEGSPAADAEISGFCYRAIANGAGYSIGDVVRYSTSLIIDPATGLWSATLSMQSYFNVTTRTLVTLATLVPVVIIGAIPPVGDFVPCEAYEVAATLAIVESGGTQIAGAAIAAAAPFSGAAQNWNSSAVAGRLQSITVIAWDSTPSLPGQAPDQVIVVPPTGDKLVLSGGESRTWSITHSNESELLRDFEVFADGIAYATITWTVVQ